MASYYQTLRILPEKDIQGKSEAEIIKKIENNYKALVMRAPQMYPAAEAREKALKELEEAREVLSDPQKRAMYDERLQGESDKLKSEMVTYEVLILTGEEMELLQNEEEEQEGNQEDK